MDYSYILTDLLSLTLLFLGLVALLVLCFHYWTIFWRVGRFGNKGKRGSKTSSPDAVVEDKAVYHPISVVLVAHNEADWLRENLVYLLEQDYPSDFEIVVVDYTSTDDTQFVLQLCAENYPNLKVVSLPSDVNMFRGKKFPLSMGIKSAKHDILLLTEPDCVPANFNWLRAYAKCYANVNTQIVLGYCGIKQEKGLLNLLQSYENLAYSSRYFSRALFGAPETGNGKNLSYRRNFFYNKKSFTTMYTEEYGEDDLFVSQNGTARNTKVCLDNDGWVLTESKKTFGDWHLQRKVRTSTRGWHSWMERLRGDVAPLCVAILYASLVLALLKDIKLWPFVVGFLLIKFLWQIVATYQASKRLEVKKVYWLSPLLEFYFVVANTILAITPLPKKKNRWN